MSATIERAPSRRRVRSAPPALVLRGPGTNCDRETEVALELAGAATERVHFEEILAGRRRLDEFAILALPGGFSFGDHAGAGTLLAHRLERVRDDLDRFVAAGKPLIGICNGFQALMKLGVLTGGALGPNASGRFECRWVWLKNVAPANPLLRGIDLIALPIAHGEGRLVTTPKVTADALKANGRAPLVYCDARGDETTYPGDPNGSDGAIAALSNPAGNVLGLMPHPERNVLPHQAPAGRPPAAGLTIFRNAVAMAKG